MDRLSCFFLRAFLFFYCSFFAYGRFKKRAAGARASRFARVARSLAASRRCGLSTAFACAPRNPAWLAPLWALRAGTPPFPCAAPLPREGARLAASLSRGTIKIPLSLYARPRACCPLFSRPKLSGSCPRARPAPYSLLLAVRVYVAPAGGRALARLCARA